MYPYQHPPHPQPQHPQMNRPIPGPSSSSSSLAAALIPTHSHTHQPTHQPPQHYQQVHMQMQQHVQQAMYPHTHPHPQPQHQQQQHLIFNPPPPPPEQGARSLVVDELDMHMSVGVGGAGVPQFDNGWGAPSQGPHPHGHSQSFTNPHHQHHHQFLDQNQQRHHNQGGQDGASSDAGSSSYSASASGFGYGRPSSGNDSGTTNGGTEEPWPDPRGLLPLGADVGSVYGGEVPFGVGMSMGMGMDMGGGMDMTGFGSMQGMQSLSMGGAEMSMGYDMTVGVAEGLGMVAGYGMAGSEFGARHGMQMGMGTGMGFGVGVGVAYEGTGTSREGSTGRLNDGGGGSGGGGGAGGGWAPIHSHSHPQPPQQTQVQRPSSSVSSGSGSSLAHAIQDPTSALAPTPSPPASAQGSAYHSHGVPQTQAQAQGVEVQARAGRNVVGMGVGVAQLDQQQQHGPVPGPSSQSALHSPSVQSQQPHLQQQPQHHQHQQQQQQQQARPPQPPQPPKNLSPPKLLPGQTEMLPPPGIPSRPNKAKLGRPPNSQAAAGTRVGRVRRGSIEDAFDSTPPVVPSTLLSTTTSRPGYVYPQVAQQMPQHRNVSVPGHPPRATSLPDLHSGAQGQAYSRSPLAHRYSDDELQRASVRQQPSPVNTEGTQDVISDVGAATASPLSAHAHPRESSAGTPSEGASNATANAAASVSSSSRSPPARIPTPRPPSFELATTTMTDGQWAIAQACNRQALTETFRLRHGRDPPASMDILRTSALERSISVEEALMTAVGEEGEEGERMRKLREEARRAWREDDEPETEEEKRANERASRVFWETVGGEGESQEQGQGWRPAQSTMPAEPWGQTMWAPPPPPGPVQSSSEDAQAAGPSGLLANVAVAGQPLVSPVSPNTPDEAVTPSDGLFARAAESQLSIASALTSADGGNGRTSSSPMQPTSNVAGPSTSASTTDIPSLLPSTETQTSPPQSAATDGPLATRLRPIIRHDGHLPHHVSGLGGAFSEAYDGRSYLPDDAEMDPEHVPRDKPRRARMGDNPLLDGIRPHPLKVRGERWHPLISPNPDPNFKGGVMKLEDGEGTAGEGEGDGDGTRVDIEPVMTVEDIDPDASIDATPRPVITKQDIEATQEPNELGDGYGFPEGGSLGPGLGLRLPGLGEDGAGDNAGAGTGKPRLRLSTEKKAPPKMACHFCRNRKIACGVGTGEDKTCNQCKRRGLRCVYPTESRRGMRVRKPRSAHTVDGVDESVKDAEGPTDEDAAAATSPSAGMTKGKRGRKAKRGRGRPPRQSRDHGAENADADDAMDVEDADTNANANANATDMPVPVPVPVSGDSDGDYGYPDTDNPLASLAAEARRQELHWQTPAETDMNMNMNMEMGMDMNLDMGMPMNGGTFSYDFGQQPHPQTQQQQHQQHQQQPLQPTPLPDPTSMSPPPGPVQQQQQQRASEPARGLFTTSPLHRRGPGRPRKVRV